MPLDTYAALQTSILSWLARPGDPLVSPAVPDMIQLFEREATRRLKVGGAEKRASLTALSAAVALPADFGELRLATSGGVILTYVTPMQLPDGGGPPAHYTIIGNEMRLGPAPSSSCTIEIVYQSGVPPLSDTNPSNWLLTQHPDCYLFGALVEAESFIGQDDRISLWAQRREAAFSSIESADRKARWGGAPLSIRAEGVSGGNGTAAGDWTSAPPVPIPIAAIVAGDGLTGGGSEGIVTVALETPVAISRGGTGGTTAAAALANLGGAPLASPVLTGDPRAPTPLAGDNDTSIATTAFVAASYAPLASPAFTGNPTAPTPAPGDADTSIATSAFVGAALSAQALAGDVTGPTSATLVVRLQGRPVASTAPTGSQVLQWSGTAWGPASIAGGGTVTSISAGAGITVTPNPIVGTGSVALTVPVAVANGGTGATTAGAALAALGAAPLASPVLTGDPRAPTPATADNDTSIATTGYVQAQGYATTAAMTAAGALKAPLVSPVFTGDPQAPTPATADNDTSIATTAYVQAQGYATTAAMTTADNLRVLKAGDQMSGSLGIGAAAPGGGSAWLRVMNTTNTATYEEIARFAVANNAGATNYSELAVLQNTTNAMAIDVRNQANAKGQLQLQPFGGTVIIGPVSAQSAYFTVAGNTTAGGISQLVTGGPTGTDTTTYLLNFADAAVTGGIGGITRTGSSSVLYLTTSDGRLKEDITPSEIGLDALMQIKISEFKFPGDERVQQGVVAQELYEVYPDAVHAGGEDAKLDPWGVDYGRLTPLLIRTIQQLAARLDALEAGVPTAPRRRQ